MKTNLSASVLLPLSLVCALVLISSCEDDDEPEIKYRETGFYGENLLMKGKTQYNAANVSLHAWIPDGKKLKIVITGKSTVDHGNYLTGVWYILSGTGNNWAISNFDRSTFTQTFQSIDGGITCEYSMTFEKGSFQIDYYENGSTSPTTTKTVVFDF